MAVAKRLSVYYRGYQNIVDRFQQPIRQAIDDSTSYHLSKDMTSFADHQHHHQIENTDVNFEAHPDPSLQSVFFPLQQSMIGPIMFNYNGCEDEDYLFDDPLMIGESF
jgi:hypothetical protein